MLIHIQFPIADLRGFGPAPRLAAPNWPTPLLDEEFMRSAGMVRKRWKGGLSGWIAEESYCDCHNSIKIAPAEWHRPEIKAWHPSVVFRRFYFDGTSVAKFEIGFEIKRPPATRAEFDTLIQGLSSLRLKIRKPRAPSLLSRVMRKIGQTIRKQFGHRHRKRRRPRAFDYLPLFEAGKALASLYGPSSTPNGERLDASLVTSGTPILFIEAEEDELSPGLLPPKSQPIALAPKGFELFHWWRKEGRLSHVWVCINHDGLAQDIRNLRVYLLRLNAEQQAFARTLKAISADKVNPRPGSTEAKVLKTYLDETTTNLLSLSAKTRKFAEGRSDLLGVVAAASEVSISANEREALKKKLDDLELRKDIFKKVETQATGPDWTGAKAEHKPPTTVNTIFYIDFYIERFQMDAKQSAMLAFAFGVLFVSILLAVNLFVPNPTPTQWITFRIILALAAGGVGAMIPGFLNVNFTPSTKFALQAGGALAVFVIVYFFSPGLPPPA